VGLYKRSRCEIRNIENPKWYCSIDEGIQGMKYSLFSPDSFHILSICEYNIKLSIRSLLDKSLFFIKFPKFAKKGLSFSSKGNFMALAERRDAKDIIGVYYIKKWICIKRFEVASEDLQDVKWSYDNSSLLIPDTPSLCKLLIYSPVGDLIANIEIYQFKLGIKNLKISPNGHYICLGLYDQSLRIFNNISYTCVSIFNHNKEIFDDVSVNYYKEQIINKENETKYIQLKPPIDIKNENIYIKGKNLFNDKMPKIGISKISFSYDNMFLATKNDNMPNILFIWNLFNMNLQTVLIQLSEINYFEWAKNQNILFICTNNNKLYYFTIDSCKILQLAPDFQNKSLVFSPDGTKMMAKDSNDFIMINITMEKKNYELNKIIPEPQIMNKEIINQDNNIIDNKQQSEGNENNEEGGEEQRSEMNHQSEEYQRSKDFHEGEEQEMEGEELQEGEEYQEGEVEGEEYQEGQEEYEGEEEGGEEEMMDEGYEEASGKEINMNQSA
jgi:WD40 repeat protein